MTTLKELISVLKEVENLDPENENSQVSIVGKRIFIMRKDQVDGYYVEIKDWYELCLTTWYLLKLERLM